LEGLGYGCRNHGFTLAINVHLWCVQETLRHFAVPELQARYLPHLSDGTWVGAYALTEPEAGSDAFSMQTRAEADGDCFVLNGAKCTIGLAPEADVILLFARTDPHAGNWGISAFLLDRGTAGLEFTGPGETMGLRGAPLGDLVLRDCRVPASQLVGGLNGGLPIVVSSLEMERAFVLSSHVGAMAAQLDRCVAYSKERRQFDRPISDFQAVSHRLADMRLRLEQARGLLYHVARLKQEGAEIGMEAALTNLCISEGFLANSEAAMRVHGSKGYLSKFGVEQDFRDAAGAVIYSGTSDIQRNLIARYLGL
jgi:alkylation response protein AidB-like acyl-CoA dehydrogenase